MTTKSILPVQTFVNAIASGAKFSAFVDNKAADIFATVNNIDDARTVAKELTLIKVQALESVRQYAADMLNDSLQAIELDEDADYYDRDDHLKACTDKQLKALRKSVVNKIGYLRSVFNLHCASFRIESEKRGKEYVLTAHQGAAPAKPAKVKKPASGKDKQPVKAIAAAEGQSTDSLANFSEELAKWVDQLGADQLHKMVDQIAATKTAA